MGLALPLVACGGEPPQIVDYAPQRGAVEVSTATPIRITFDHDVDKSSVESRLHLAPATLGNVTWLNGHQLVYEHQTLRTSTTYEVILEAGYRDVAGNTYSLRHHWSFVTERPPAFTGSSPSNADSGVDPAAYLSLAFTRPMDSDSLKGALSLVPFVPVDVRLDPTDNHRAVVAPSELLTPNTKYLLTLDTGALDADGNHLDRQLSIAFTTGPARPLHHWITFATSRLDGTPGALWMVNESGFPRVLYGAATVRQFEWSPGGELVLLGGDAQTWSTFAPGEGSRLLNFKAAWAAPLASGMGYVYIDAAHNLHRQAAQGADSVIATSVQEASVSPIGSRVIFISAGQPNTIWGYDVGVRATYLLAGDTAPVFAATWAPAGNRVAYLRRDTNTLTLRVKNLTGSSGTSTVVAGDIQSAAWLPDSIHILVGAAVSIAQGKTSKAFMLNALAPPGTLAAASGLPADPDVEVASPVPSPDGHQIAFLSNDQIWLMNADGTRPTPLTKQDPGSFPYSCRAVAWTRG